MTKPTTFESHDQDPVAPPPAASPGEHANADTGPTPRHPFEPHDDDLVVVEVLVPQGVSVDGRRYVNGQTLTLTRGRAAANNRPGRPVFRILTTVRYHNDPNPEGTYEHQLDQGPLEIS